MSSPIDTKLDLDALFRKQVQASPDAVALQDVHTSYTYRELDARVEGLSLHLRRTYGVGPDVGVGVLFSRCADYVIACMAALRAGGAYVVLELAYPASLLQDVVEDARPAVVLTHAAHLSMIRAQVPVVALDQPEVLAQIEADRTQGDSGLQPLPPSDDLDKLAFVAYVRRRRAATRSG